MISERIAVSRRARSVSMFPGGMLSGSNASSAVGIEKSPSRIIPPSSPYFFPFRSKTQLGTVEPGGSRRSESTYAAPKASTIALSESARVIGRYGPSM